MPRKIIKTDQSSATTVPIENIFLEQIFAFLCSFEISLCGIVCKQWRETSNCNSLWKTKYHSFIKDRFNSLEISIKEWVSSLSLPQIKCKLKSFNIHHPLSFQRTELVELLWKGLLFSDPNIINVRKTGKIGWLEEISEWKLTYFCEKKDAKRNRILVEELTQIKWHVEFLFETHNKLECTSTFQADGTFTYKLFNTCFQLPWAFHTNFKKIIVGDYPDIIVKRQPDGKWVLSNDNVVFHQKVSLSRII